jgi:hypothetical protein
LVQRWFQQLAIRGWGLTPVFDNNGKRHPIRL